jgi:hypothetical protein
MDRLKRTVVSGLAVWLIMGASLAFAERAKERRTVAQIAYYFDSRQFNTATVITSTDQLPLGFSIWGFADFHSAPKDTGERFDFNRYFIEYRLLRPLEPKWLAGLKGVGTVIEYNDLEGGENSLVRFGVSYKRVLPWHGAWIQGRVFPLETDGNGGQAALTYCVHFTADLFILGFIDYNWLEGGADRWVGEPQLFYKINERFTTLVEFRFNEFERHDKGLAVGIDLAF